MPFYKTQTKAIDVKINVLYQINPAKSIVFIEYAFDEEQNNLDKLEMVKAPFFRTLQACKGVMLDMGKTDGLYCVDAIITAANPRSHPKLLDEEDLIYCLDLGCVDTRIHGLPAPASMGSGVAMERHKTLDWLVGVDGAEWDVVTPNT